MSDVLCAPADPGPFAQFAGAAAARYAPLGVHDWEIWNEPNGAFWLPAPNPAAYVAWLRVMPAIKAADPEATVISGGLLVLLLLRRRHTLSARLSPGVLLPGGRHTRRRHRRPPILLPGSSHLCGAVECVVADRQHHDELRDDPRRQRRVVEAAVAHRVRRTHQWSGSGGDQHGLQDRSQADHVSEALQAQMATIAVRQLCRPPYRGAVLVH